MVRIAKKTDPQVLKKLKLKIDDQRYLQLAIKQIASRLTDQIFNRTGDKNE